MPRVRLPAHFLRPRSSPAASCASCQAAGPSTSSSPSAPSPSRRVISSSARSSLSDEKRFPPLLRVCPYETTTTTPSSTAPRRLSSSSSSIGDPRRRDLILGVEQVLTLDDRKPPCRRVHSSSAVLNANDNANSELDLHERQEFRADSSSSRNPFVVNPSLQDFEEDEEGEEEEAQVVVVDTPAVFSRDSRASSGENGRPTTLLYDDDEEEVITELNSSEEEESDLSDLEGFEDRYSPQAEDRDDGHLEAEDGRPEGEEDVDAPPFWELHGASTESDNTPEQHFSNNWSQTLSTIGQDDSHEGGLLTAGDHDDNGVAYLHTLSVDEVRGILEKARAKDVKILQVGKSCEWVDQLVFASGRSSKHLRGMADAIVYKVKQRSENVGPNSFPVVEGRDGEQWMAIDCGNIVVHLFLEEARSYYNLEEFWRKKSNPRLVETY